MLAIKIYNKKDKRNDTFKKTIGNLIGHVYNKLSMGEVKVVSDYDCVEFISGKDDVNLNVDFDKQIVAELLIRKTIVINNEDFKDRAELDKFMTRIKHFCEQAKEIETAKYYPVDIRKTG